VPIQLERGLARRLMLVIVGGLTVSGVALAVAALVAVLLGRDSLGVLLFAVSSLVLAVLTVGWAIAMSAVRISGRSASRPR
jgi:hypothetical protein